MADPRHIILMRRARFVAATLGLVGSGSHCGPAPVAPADPIAPHPIAPTPVDTALTAPIASTSAPEPPPPPVFAGDPEPCPPYRPFGTNFSNRGNYLGRPPPQKPVPCLAPPRPDPCGTLVVQSDVPCEWTLDGQPIDENPTRFRRRLEPAEHVLTCRREDGTEETKTVQIEARRRPNQVFVRFEKKK